MLIKARLNTCWLVSYAFVLLRTVIVSDWSTYTYLILFMANFGFSKYYIMMNNKILMSTCLLLIWIMGTLSLLMLFCVNVKCDGWGTKCCSNRIFMVSYYFIPACWYISLTIVFCKSLLLNIAQCRPCMVMVLWESLLW